MYRIGDIVNASHCGELEGVNELRDEIVLVFVYLS